MPKYRTLSTEELSSLEKEFVDFLILNGITSDDWVKLKKNDLSSAEGIIEAFSDVVFEQILRKAKFLDFRNATDLMCIQCLDEKMILVGAKSNGKYDFTENSLEEFAAGAIKVYTVEKAYNEQRETEIFKLLTKGYQLSDGSLFKQLCLVL